MRRIPDLCRHDLTAFCVCDSRARLATSTARATIDEHLKCAYCRKLKLQPSQQHLYSVSAYVTIAGRPCLVQPRLHRHSRWTG